MRTGRRCALTRRPQRPADLFSKGMFRARGRGPAGRTHTCRRWRQVRDLIIAQTGGRPLLSACHVSGSEGRRRGDSLRNLFAPQLQSDERNSKNHWFLAAFFPPFLPLLEEMGPPEACNKKETDAAASVSFLHARLVRQLLRQIRLQLADGHTHPAPRPTSLRGGPDLTSCWGEMNSPQRKILAAPKCLHAASAAEGAGAPSTLPCRF